MEARLKTQIRRKKYQDALRSNYQQSVSMAITDSLTGLYNRHFLDAHLNNMVNSSINNKKSFSVMILDMDHFKAVNDTYGHDAGDEILKALTKRIIDSIRSSDLAARIGGEEFMVLLPETNIADAYILADRIRAKIGTTPFVVSHEIELTKTISIGIAELNLSGDNAAAMIKRADNALYEAKNTGRNKVCPILKINNQPPRPFSANII
jgi:two-component system cell cycle response regulator